MIILNLAPQATARHVRNLFSAAQAPAAKSLTGFSLPKLSPAAQAENDIAAKSLAEKLKAEGHLESITRKNPKTVEIKTPSSTFEVASKHFQISDNHLAEIENLNESLKSSNPNSENFNNFAKRICEIGSLYDQLDAAYEQGNLCEKTLDYFRADGIEVLNPIAKGILKQRKETETVVHSQFSKIDFSDRGVNKIKVTKKSVTFATKSNGEVILDCDKFTRKQRNDLAAVESAGELEKIIEQHFNVDNVETYKKAESVAPAKESFLKSAVGTIKEKWSSFTDTAGKTIAYIATAPMRIPRVRNATVGLLTFASVLTPTLLNAGKHSGKDIIEKAFKGVNDGLNHSKNENDADILLKKIGLQGLGPFNGKNRSKEFDLTVGQEKALGLEKAEDKADDDKIRPVGGYVGPNNPNDPASKKPDVAVETTVPLTGRQLLDKGFEICGNNIPKVDRFLMKHFGKEVGEVNKDDLTTIFPIPESKAIEFNLAPSATPVDSSLEKPNNAKQNKYPHLDLEEIEKLTAGADSDELNTLKIELKDKLEKEKDADKKAIIREEIKIVSKALADSMELNRESDPIPDKTEADATTPKEDQEPDPDDDDLDLDYEKTKHNTFRHVTLIVTGGNFKSRIHFRDAAEFAKQLFASIGLPAQEDILSFLNKKPNAELKLPKVIVDAFDKILKNHRRDTAAARKILDQAITEAKLDAIKWKAVDSVVERYSPKTRSNASTANLAKRSQSRQAKRLNNNEFLPIEAFTNPTKYFTPQNPSGAFRDEFADKSFRLKRGELNPGEVILIANQEKKKKKGLFGALSNIASVVIKPKPVTNYLYKENTLVNGVPTIITATASRKGNGKIKVGKGGHPLARAAIENAISVSPTPAAIQHYRGKR